MRELKKMRIENVNVFTEDGVFRKGAVVFDEAIRKVEIDPDPGQDTGLYLIPGLIDIHTHGAVNGDHSDGSREAMHDMARFYIENGVTSFLATTITCSREQLADAMDNVSRYSRKRDSARCAGVNMEGPFLSYEKRGAHTHEFLEPPDNLMFQLMDAHADCSIRLVSIAPELPGAMDFIKGASKICRVALAHSAADYDTAMEAFQNGARHVTHLFNAMNPFLHRDPGIPGAAMDSCATVEIVCDGIHLHPSVVRAAFKMFPDRVCLVSDSIRCTGLPEGDYELGGLPVTVKNGKVTLEDGTIAGSSARLVDCLRNAVGYGIPLEKAVAAATINSARAIGLDGKYGVLKPRACADMVLLDSNLEIKEVYIEGFPLG